MPEKQPGDYAEIWKFPLEVQREESPSLWEGDYEVKIPGPGTILSVQVQHGVPTIWATIWPGCKEVVRRFRLVPTGKGYPLGNIFLGTVQLGGGAVLHVFEVA